MTEKSQPIHEISELLSPHFTNSPLKEVFSHFNQRAHYQTTLLEALHQIGFSHFSNDVFIGEINDQGKIRLFARSASIISKLKNKLPSLLHYFREAGFKVTEIQLRVLPKTSSPSASPSELSAPTIKITFTPAQIKAWEKLLENTDPSQSTYPAIKQLIANAKKNLTQPS